ncbi:FAD binding domain-containing protein [Phaeosphaeria sp. MPI-PUGE-AT-0046c]|nr:FAD binding domain-containing protein [Phaeosphaeria sp. MPI-PUGE-AT-0046c]
MGSIAVSNEDVIRALEKYGVSVDAFVDDITWVADRLYDHFPKQVLRISSHHDSWKRSYWSACQRSPTPAAIFEPKSAKEVAIAVLLCKGAKCRFAVRSGGHAPMKNASSIDDGLVIDMKNLNTIQLSEDKSIASIGTGNRWEAVFRELEKDGLGVAGGRSGDVGVGGYTLGGGISFFASATGWGCDTIRNYELVTANGDLINVNQESHPDLYWALRGGGNNFGIVTHFDYETFPQGDVFAGNLLYDVEHKDAAMKAFNTYSNHGDPKAATWMSIAWLEGRKLMSALAMYSAPDPDAKVLQSYLSIPALHKTAKVRSMADMVHEVAEVQTVDHFQSYTNRTFKFDPDFALWLADMFWAEMDAGGEPYESKQAFVLVLQIYTKESVALMQRNGGNCLGLKVEDAPYLNVLIPSAWRYEKDNERAMNFIAKILGRVVEEGKRRGLVEDFMYMNYAAAGQDVLKGYGAENYDRLKKIAEKYDPDEVFQKLMPGYFKFGGAPT